MRLKYFSVFISMLFFFKLNAQDTNKMVLFTVSGEPVYVSEFIRVYNKNLDLVQDESQKNVDEYLSMFTNYKLKLKEAKALDFDKKETYLKELKSYKKQLAKNFLTDTKVTDQLVQEAYQRVSNDVKASHILIRLSESATPQDTLAAYNQILNLRTKAIKEGFEKIRDSVHNGKTVFGENLGYFSGFKMVYEFESVAFNTPVGEVSLPFRTQFGYHIINVLDKRKSRGEITVAHIMVIDKQDEGAANTSESRINDIYKKINQGEAFDALAKQFSDDKSSASNGGEMAPFSSGQISSVEFEDAAFGLQNIGDISKPIQSAFGWHIIKLINKRPIESFDAIKSELETKVKRDSRSKLINNALQDRLRQKYNIANNPEAINYFVSILNENFYNSSWSLPKDFPNAKALFTIGDQQITYKDFVDVLVKSQKRTRNNEAFINIVTKAYDAFLSERLVEYQEDSLEYENEEFANIIREYRDGLLLFDLMENTIWNAVKKDSLGIQNYYNANKEKYFHPEQIEAVVASSAKKKTLKKVSKLLEKNMPLSQIKNLVNSNDQVNVIFTSDTMDQNHQALPQNFKFEKGLSKTYSYNDAYVLVQVKNIIPKKQKTFDEAKGIVTSDYQTYKEEEWIKTLKSKYEIILNNDALAQVKNIIKKQ